MRERAKRIWFRFVSLLKQKKFFGETGETGPPYLAAVLLMAGPMLTNSRDAPLDQEQHAGSVRGGRGLDPQVQPCHIRLSKRFGVVHLGSVIARL